MKQARRYERRPDLDAFHRPCRFVRWAGPDLEARDVHRILSHAEGWSTAQIDRHAGQLEHELACRALTAAQVVPAAVTGEWERRRTIWVRGRSGRLLRWTSSGSRDLGTNTAFSASPSSLKVPGLINGAPPTPPALQALTTDLRETLALLVEGQHGVAYDRIASWIRGRITLEPVGEITFGPPRREAWRAGWRIGVGPSAPPN
jgi:hypothetical protein